MDSKRYSGYLEKLLLLISLGVAIFLLFLGVQDIRELWGYISKNPQQEISEIKKFFHYSKN